jgi:Zn-dependent peptidase ImmA (M78 family)
MSVRELKKIHAQVNILRIQATRLLRYTEIRSTYTFHRIDMQKCGGPSTAAKRLRYLWQLPTGPIRSVVGAVERAGGIVFHCPFDTVHVDGISQWPLDTPELPPVFFVNSKLPGDRQRLTLAHEIGHITLHHLPTDDPEREASEFAGEFLMPANEVRDELAELTLPKAAALKSRWKVSIQAIVFRACQLGAITEARYAYLFKELSQKGYRKCEPVPLPAEVPNMLREMIRVHKSSSGQTTTDLSSFIGMLEEDFREAYWRDISGVRLVG